MAKEFNYNYYGIDTTVWPSAGENIAKMVKGNTWNYYSSGGDPIAATFGKPFDDSVALWRLMPDASFACQGYIYAKPGSVLDVEFKANTNENSVPLIMQATYTGSNYTTYPHYRIADNYTNNEKLVYSRLCYDINPQKFCLNVQTWLWDRTADNNNATALDQIGGLYRSLSSVANVVNNNNNYKVVCIRNFMYFGGSESPRDTAGKYITQNLLNPLEQQQPCVPICEPYAYRPLPDDANMRKRMKYMFSAEEHSDWTTDKVFSPFSQSGAGVWYSALGAPTSNDNQYNIGVLRSWTRNQVQTGAFTIPDTGGKISGQWLNCNFGRKDFDDVAYHWRSYVWDAEHKVEIDNGLPLNLIGSSSYIRLVTELVIDDRKGLTLGEATANAVKHEVAYIGFYFAGDSTHAANSVLGDQGTGEGIYLPKRVDGIPNGEYYTGEDLVNSDEAKQTDTEGWVNEGNINPISGDIGDFSTRLHTGFTPSGGSVYWVLTETAANDLIDYINKFRTRATGESDAEISPPTTPMDYSDQDSLEQWRAYYDAKSKQVEIDWQGVDPWEYIISLKWYPFAPPKYPNSTDYIHLGAWETPVSTDKLYQRTSMLRMASFDLTNNNSKMPYYGNWRDYDCTITLMLPFIGSMELDPALYIGHTLNVDYCIDWRIGTVTAYISRDDFIVDSRQGTCGADIPLSLASCGTYQNAIHQIEAARTQAELSTAGAIAATALTVFGNIALAVATGGASIPAQIAVGAAAGGLSAATNLASLFNTEENLDYQLSHTPVHVGSVSSADPLANTAVDWRVQLLIAYPTSSADDATYAKTVGYACCMQGTLSDFDGYVVCSGANLDSVSCTKQEAEAIKQLLQSGIINN